jgi:DNA-binding SARP family transcriptional activator
VSVGPRRFHPLALRADRRISRPRLNHLLAQRFDAKLTVVTAAAGHGKSTALAEALANNILAPAGLDILMAATEADADPTHLLAGLAQSIDLEPIADQDRAIQAIADQIWAKAPTDVAIIIDDAHLLAADGSVKALQRLIDALPTNGHLLLAGRAPLPLQLVRLQALEMVIEITQDQLLFDGDEIIELTRSRNADPDDTKDLPRLPALADLQLRVGTNAGVDYLWEEILGRLDADRLQCLVRTAVLEDLDEAMVRALSDGRFGASELVADLPMIESGEHQRYRLHSLLRQALLAQMDPVTMTDACRRAARVEQDRHRLVVATKLLSKAGDTTQALEIIQRVAGLPLLGMSLDETSAIISLTKRIAPDSLLLAVLEAQLDYGSYDDERIQHFVQLARRAEAEGDEDLEALAIHRAFQGLEQGPNPLPADLLQRIGILATEGAYAKAVDAHIGSAGAIRRGDGETARQLLRYYEGFDPAARQLMVAERLCQLGLLEDVASGQGADDLSERPQGFETYAALAMWLRGEADPGLALAVVSNMISGAVVRSWRYNAIAVLSVGAHIALAAGDHRMARHWATRAERLSADNVAPGIQAYAKLAAASVARADEAIGEVAPGTADALLDAALDAVPVGQWPVTAYLLALPLIYSTRPDSRDVLDDCGFGPALTTAVQAGRALAELREDGSAEGAKALPWSDSRLLSVHVLPCDLMELAMAAADGGTDEAMALAEHLPGSRELAERVAGLEGQPGSVRAAEFVSSLPLPPPPPLRLRALGELQPQRHDAPIDDSTWRRARVRELLGFLVEHRSASRKDIAQALWPDHDEAKSGSNLRVNLSHLLSALEPDRPSGAASSYLIVDGERLGLTDAVEVDVDELDECMAEARRLDREGAPADALSLYRRAAALVEGPYLDGISADWAFATRVRVQSATVEAWCRIGELTLAQGEPEAASEWATKAYRTSNIDERAARLLISSLAAVGDRVGAINTGLKLVDDLSEAGLDPEQMTLQLIDRIRRRG